VSNKAFRHVEVKNADLGQIQAVFATLDVVDKDGDITVKGAFTEGESVRISAYNHKSWEGALPVGKGVVREQGNDVVFDGQFFLNTTHGRDTFETIKALCEDGPGMEWSYGFDVVDSEPAPKSDNGARRILKKMKVHEVSPVMIGAGVDTRVLSLKGEKKTFVEHLTEVLASVKAVGVRAAEVKAMRQEKSKDLGEDSTSLLTSIREELSALDAILKSAPDEEVTTTETLTEEQVAELRRVWMNSVRIAHEGV
jgi:HK97 family phage prohead protease